MTRLRPAITAAATPDPQSLLKDDLSFHLGERDWYDFDDIETVAASRIVPNDSFVVLRGRQILAGEFYKKNCAFVQGGFLCRAGVVVNRLQAFTMGTINRDMRLIDEATPVCLDFHDKRDFDYGGFFDTPRPVPVFQYHRRRGLRAILHPLKGYHDSPSPNIPNLTDRTPFAAKRAKLFWRGRLHGNAIAGGKKLNLVDVAARRDLPEKEKLALLRQSLRFRLCEATASGCEIIDARLVIRLDGPIFSQPIKVLEGLCGEQIDRSQQLAYKYLLALDGYDGPSTHYWALGTNSLVLRQESDWEMFGDCYFLPWIHYVPFADETDLFEKFQWCERHQAKCEGMVENARRAWSVLYDPAYNLLRRKELFARYRDWCQKR